MMWFFWYFLLIFALFGSALPMIWMANKLDSKIKAGNHNAALLKASLVTVAALTIWACLLLQPFSLTAVEQHWWRYLSALFVIFLTTAEWQKVRQSRQQKPAEQTSEDVKMKQ